MSKVNVSYTKCICDVCGKEKHIEQSCLLPKEWKVVNVGTREWDCCKECSDEISDIIDSFAHERKVDYH